MNYKGKKAVAIEYTMGGKKVKESVTIIECLIERKEDKRSYYSVEFEDGEVLERWINDEDITL